MKSNHKNFVHLVVLYTQYKTMHGAYSIKLTKEHLKTRQLSDRYEHLSLGNTMWGGYVNWTGKESSPGVIVCTNTLRLQCQGLRSSPQNRPRRPRGGAHLQLYSSFNLEARGGRWSTSESQPLYPRERPGTHCTGGWVGSRAGLDGCGKARA